MSYEMHVNVGVAGTDTLNAATAATEKLDDRTRKIAEAIQGHILANTKLTDVQAKLALQEVQLEQLREKHRMQTDALAASMNRAAASHEQFNAGIQKGTGNVRDITAALRTMEGAMPIRSAARLLDSIQGFGPALQAAFPLFGAVALFGVVEKTAEKLGLHLNIWKEIANAEKDATRELKQYSDEAAQASRRVRDIQQELITMRQGPLAGAQNEMQTRGAEAGQAQTNVARLQRGTESLNRVIAFGRSFQHGGGGPAPTAEDLRNLGMIGINLTPEQVSMFGEGSLRELEIARPTKEAELRAARNIAFEKQKDFELAQERAKKEADRVAEDKQREDERKRREGLRDQEKAYRPEEQLMELEKRAMEYGARQIFGTDALGRSQDALGRLQIEQAYAIGRNPRLRSQIEGVYGIEIAGAQQNVAQQMAAYPHAVEEMGLEGEHLGEEVNKRFMEGLHKALTGDSALEKAFPGLFGATAAPLPPAGYVSPERALRLLQDQERRSLGQVSLQQRLRGGTGEDIEGTYRERIDFAEKEYQAQLRINSVKEEGAKRDMADLEALDAKKQKIYDAEMERDNAILNAEIEQQHQVVDILTGVIEAAQHGRAPQFMRGQVQGWENTAIKNVLGMVLGTDTGTGLLSHLHLPGILGQVLQGTPFGSDPAKTATNANTVATQANTAATQNLTTALSGRGGAYTPGGSSGIGGIGGYSSAGSSGIGGIGGYSSMAGGGDDFSSLDTGPLSPTYDYSTSQVIWGNPAAAALQQSGYSGLTASKMIGIAGAAAAGVMGAIKGFSSGGPSGDLTGSGSLLGAGGSIAMLAGATGPAAPIVAGAGMLLGLLGSLLGTGPQQRETNIQKSLQTSQFMAPTAIDMTMDVGGHYSDVNRFGTVRTSNLSPIPQVTQGYYDFRYGVTVPGSVVSPFGGPGANAQSSGTHTTINIAAMDSQDVSRVLTRHMPAVGEALNAGLQTGRAGTALAETIRRL
jgi:hypothetical protein